MLSSTHIYTFVINHVTFNDITTAQDVVFTVSHGKLKPAKHLCLGIGMKTLTGSKKVINILNRFGHSVNYSLVEEIETAKADNINEKAH